MSMVMKMAVKAVAPYLNKITDGLDSMAEQFGVEEAFLMVRKKVDSSGKAQATLVFMAPQNGSLVVLKDKQGNPAEYPIERLIDLITGDALEEEDED